MGPRKSVPPSKNHISIGSDSVCSAQWCAQDTDHRIQNMRRLQYLPMHAMRHKNCKKLATFSKKKSKTRAFLAQSFTSCMPLLTAPSAFGLARRRWSSHRHCHLHYLRTLNYSNFRSLRQRITSTPRLCPQTTRCSPAKPVHVALNGGVQVALEPIHDKQHSRKPSPTPGAVLVVDD